MKKIAIAAILSAFVAAPALAADTYLGVNVGKNQTDYSGVNSSTAIGVLGGYTINQHVAAEVAYTNLGSADTKYGTSLTGHVFSIAAVGSLPLNNDFSLLGKLGLASSTVEESGYSESKSDLTYGIGAQYNASKTVGIRLGYDSFKVGSSNTKDSTLITIGAVFKL
jgi:OmpA-OmpF porin, OOP family